MNNTPIDPKDKRWGAYVPWFFRHHDFHSNDSFLLFFDRLAQRLYQLFSYNEVGIKNLSHFSSIVESKSLQRYNSNYEKQYTYSSSLIFAYGINDFFSRKKLQSELKSLVLSDAEYKSAASLKDLQDKVKKQDGVAEKYIQNIFRERMGVLEVILRNVPKPSPSFEDLIVDLRTYLVEAQIMLDINSTTYLIEPLEEPLLQKEVIENLMPRLASRYPERAKEFSKAYHDMIGGKDFDEIFVGAFKSLEELARAITGNNKFHFTESDLGKHFPKLHGQIHATIIKLKAQRDDKGAHGKSAPKPYEMRYLLFSIINIALLLLDYEA